MNQKSANVHLNRIKISKYTSTAGSNMFLSNRNSVGVDMATD